MEDRIAMKRAQTVEPGRVEITDEAIPELAPAQVRVRVEQVGVCGSDVHLFRGRHPYGRYPQTQGHEVVGIVEAHGSAVAGAPGIGSRVVIEPFLSCGECYACRRGLRNACIDIRVMGAHTPGALVESIDVDPGQLHPTGLDPDVAVLVEPITIGSQAVRRGRVGEGDRVAVFGAGLVGLGAVLAANDAGAVVAAVDVVGARLDAAAALGASHVVDPTVRDTAAALAEIFPDGPEVVVEATGSPEVLAQAIELVAVGGRVVVVGISEREVSLPMITFTRKEIEVLGSRNNLGLFAETERLVARHRDELRRSVRTAHFPLAATQQALIDAEERRADVEKVVIDVKEASA
jgi:L-gulonate 5-dehydrogenase